MCGENNFANCMDDMIFNRQFDNKMICQINQPYFNGSTKKYNLIVL